MPWCHRDNEDEGDESHDRDAIPIISRLHRPPSGLERLDLGTSYVDGYEGEDGNDGDVAEEEDALQADDGSTQNVEN
jgi:hypothetical protein